MSDLKLELEPSPRMAKLASFELEYLLRPGLYFNYAIFIIDDYPS